MSTDLEAFLGGKTAAAKFEDKAYGTVIGGEIIAEPAMVQQRDYTTGDLLFYEDGNPKMQMVAKVQAQPASGDDDGVRAFYIKGQMREALIEALKSVGEKVPRRGGTLHFKYMRDEPVTLKNGRPGNPQKIYLCKYAPPSGAAGEFLGTAPIGARAEQATMPSNLSRPAADALPTPIGVDPARWAQMSRAQQEQMYDALGMVPAGATSMGASNTAGTAFSDEPPF